LYTKRSSTNLYIQTNRDLRFHVDARFTSRSEFMQFEVERFIIWNQAALSRTVDPRAIPVEHFSHQLGEDRVPKFNAYAIVQIVNSRPRRVIYPSLLLTQMGKPIHIFSGVIAKVGFGVMENAECVRTRLYEGYSC